MTAPVTYQRLKNFTQYALEHTADPYNASDHDAELNAIELTLEGVLENRALIQRDDGALANDSVHPDSLSTATLLLIESAGGAGLDELVRGLWTTGTSYSPGQIVQEGTTSYICALAHISGVFSTDYAAGKWVILGETAGAGASAISFTPTGGISSTNVQAAIAELDLEKAKSEGFAGQTFLVADATAASHAVSMGQVQSNTLLSATGTGTANAMLATIASGLTVLVDGMEFIIEAPGTNTLTVPTLDLTLGSSPTGAKPIVKGNGIPLAPGDIAGNKCQFVYDASLSRWVLLNPLYQVGVSASGADPGQAKNLGLAFAVGGNSLSVSVVTAAGSQPTPSSPVEVSMRSPSIGLGTFNVRSITAPLSFVISNGSTLGHLAASPGRINWYLIDNAGVLELAGSSKYFGRSGIVSTTAEGGAGASDSPLIMYSAAARANVPFAWVGESTDTQAIAGAWLAVPTAVNLVNDVPEFLTGTAIVFCMATAPVGWTQNTTHNNKALRLVSGAGAGSGGTNPFTSAFTWQGISGSVGVHSLTTNELPYHTHSSSAHSGTSTTSGGASGTQAALTGASTSWVTGGLGAGWGHDHPFSGTSGLDLAVQYVDMIIASKN